MTRKSLTLATLVALSCAVATGCVPREDPMTSPPADAYEWRLPRGFPRPRVPADNPMTAAKVELGRHLFYDRRLSATSNYACASCHRQELAFTDGQPQAVGATGQLHPRSAMSLANVAYNTTLGWDDPSLVHLEDQARVPMFNTKPVELGLSGRFRHVASALRTDPLYQRLFSEAFPLARRPFALKNFLKALASFQRTLLSGNAPFDHWLAGEKEALTPAAHRGMKLFFSSRLGCFGCHRGFNFSGTVTYEGASEEAPIFINTGLYDMDGHGSYPQPNTGVHRLSGKIADMGRFRPPTLRNVALTAPYMHDGSVATLQQVIDFYAAGGRTDSPLKSPRLRGFELNANERADLLRFLDSLTDTSFLDEPRFADPFGDRP